MNRKDRQRQEPLWCKMYRDEILTPIKRKQTNERLGRTRESRAGFYVSKAWRWLRSKHITAHPLCVMCLEEGRSRPAQMVDHVRSITERPDLALDDSNLQSLCFYHHILKTNADKKRKALDERLEKGKVIMKGLEKKK